MSVVIETTIGDITVDLYLKERPRTCLNFLKLCKIKYYNFCLFHKIEHNFIAQSGDPSGTGRHGESVFSQLYGEQAKYFDAELKPRLKHRKLGTLSMVNNGNNMNGSQFFITLGEDLTYLDDVHTVFGEVAEGFDILVKLNDTICDSNSHPYQDIRITHTVILHDPYEDPPDLVVPPSSPLPTKELLASNYLGADEEIDDTKGRSVEEIEEEIRNKEAKARATILEMVGDIPDADVKPPETVLFVCKLNPVTTSEDLEIIFSRFGPIQSCEVIKDKKTGESLQYAFIEFEKEEHCENAYFKMDNVLIDDRRIHVDFSQSVAKLKWEPPKKSEEKSRKEKFVIKDNVRYDKGYDMVFETDDHNQNHSYRDKTDKISDKDEKKKKDRSAASEYKRRKDSSATPEHRKRKDRSATPEHKRRKDRSSTTEHKKRKGKSPSLESKHSSKSSRHVLKKETLYHHHHHSSSHKHKHTKHKSRSPSPYSSQKKHKKKDKKRSREYRSSS